MKKILVPTDFSENAFNALKYGVKLFEGEECVFYILHTYTPALYNAEFMVYSNLSLDEIYRLNVNRSLTQVINRIKKEYSHTNHSFKKLACFNLLHDEIKNQVRKKEIDIIIMGTQGTTGAAQILFGTHTIHIIKDAICPVLVIPAHQEFIPPEDILFATDFEPDVTGNNLQIIQDVARSHKSKIHILHIQQDNSLDENQEKNKKSISAYFKDLHPKFHTVESKTVTEGILNFQKENPMDILVMVRHKHSFFQNLFLRPIVDKVGFSISTPFLVVPVLDKINN